MIFCRNNCKEYEGRSQRAKRSSKLWNFSGLRNFAAQNRPLWKWPSAAKSFRSPYMASAKSRFACENGPSLRNKFCSPTPTSAKIFAATKTPLGTRVPFRSTGTPFRNCEMAAKWLRNPQSVKSPIFATIAQFRRVFRSCETPFWHTSAISQHNNSISQLRNVLRKGPPSAKMPFCCEISPPLRKLKWPLVSNF